MLNIGSGLLDILSGRIGCGLLYVGSSRLLHILSGGVSGSRLLNISRLLLDVLRGGGGVGVVWIERLSHVSSARLGIGGSGKTVHNIPTISANQHGHWIFRKLKLLLDMCR